MAKNKSQSKKSEKGGDKARAIAIKGDQKSPNKKTKNSSFFSRNKKWILIVIVIISILFLISLLPYIGINIPRYSPLIYLAIAFIIFDILLLFYYVGVGISIRHKFEQKIKKFIKQPKQEKSSKSIKSLSVSKPISITQGLKEKNKNITKQAVKESKKTTNLKLPKPISKKESKKNLQSFYFILFLVSILLFVAGFFYNITVIMALALLLMLASLLSYRKFKKPGISKKEKIKRKEEKKRKKLEKKLRKKTLKEKKQKEKLLKKSKTEFKKTLEKKAEKKIKIKPEKIKKPEIKSEIKPQLKTKPKPEKVKPKIKKPIQHSTYYLIAFILAMALFVIGFFKKSVIVMLIASAIVFFSLSISKLRTSPKQPSVPKKEPLFQSREKKSIEKKELKKTLEKKTEKKSKIEKLKPIKELQEEKIKKLDEKYKKEDKADKKELKKKPKKKQSSGMIYFILFLVSIALFAVGFFLQTMFLIVLGIVMMIFSLMFYKLKKGKSIDGKKPKDKINKKAVPLVRELPKRFRIERKQYETDFDVLYRIIEQKGRIKMSAVAKYFGIKKETVEEWAAILERHELVNIYYPAVGEPELRKWKH